jgi:hypothetical protein
MAWNWASRISWRVVPADFGIARAPGRFHLTARQGPHHAILAAMPMFPARQNWLLLLLVPVILALGGCRFGAGEERAQPAQAPLISRNLLLGDPARSEVRISPDGRNLAYLAPRNGALNLWVAPVSSLGEARAVTGQAKGRIGWHGWSPDGRSLLYTQDRDGDENWVVYALDVANGAIRALTQRTKHRLLDRLPRQGARGFLAQPSQALLRGARILAHIAAKLLAIDHIIAAPAPGIKQIGADAHLLGQEPGGGGKALGALLHDIARKKDQMVTHAALLLCGKSSRISPAVALAEPITPGTPAPGWVPAPTKYSPEMASSRLWVRK